MTQPLNLALTLSLNDRLSGALQRSVKDLIGNLSSFEKELANVVRSGDKAGDSLAKIGQKGREAGTAATALRAIGSAADQAEGRVSRLQKSMDALSKITLIGGSVFGAIGAARNVLRDPMERSQAYELRLARLSNVLYNDQRTVAGRQAGQHELDASVRRATIQGVTREEALSGLQVLGAAGGIDRKDAMSMLPTLAKFSVAGEASMEDVAGVAVKSMKGFNIKPGQLSKVLEMALVSGQMGSFEFKDMAKWLPQQMAMANGMLGMSGVGDFATLLAINQIGSNTAGNNSEAGNNIVNLLGKMNSSDTVNDFKKAGINLPGSLAQARGKGIGQVDAFFNILEGEFGKDKGYAGLQDKLKAARAAGDKGGETETLQAMQGILKGSVIGKFLQDRQALMPAIGILNDRGGLERLKREGAERMGEADLSQQVLLATAAMKNIIANSAEQARQYDALVGVNQELANNRLKLAELSVKYPEAAKWIEAMTLAAKAAAAALAVLGLGNLVGNLLPKGGPAPASGVGKVVGGVSGALASLKGGGMTSVLKKLGIGGLLFSELFSTSDREIKTLLDAEAMDAGYRGKGFDDPRIIPPKVLPGPQQIELLVRVTTDSPLFKAEVEAEWGREARRN